MIHSVAMKRIRTEPAHNSVIVLVDDEDYHFLQQHSWYIRHGYAYTTFHRKGYSRSDRNRNVNMSMARMIAERMGILCKDRKYVDHINGDRLDNRRGNLRAVSSKENSWNLARHRNGRPLGVHKTAEGYYRVRLSRVTYGNYRDRRTAELVYDRVALALRGEFAVLNHPDSTQELPEDFAIVNFNKESGAQYKSGVPGVVWFKARSCWRVIVNKKTLGYFSDVTEAIAFRRSL